MDNLPQEELDAIAWAYNDIAEHMAYEYYSSKALANIAAKHMNILAGAIPGVAISPWRAVQHKGNPHRWSLVNTSEIPAWLKG